MLQALTVTNFVVKFQQVQGKCTLHIYERGTPSCHMKLHPKWRRIPCRRIPVILIQGMLLCTGLITIQENKPYPSFTYVFLKLS
jgi:hypothetical protein